MCPGTASVAGRRLSRGGQAATSSMGDNAGMNTLRIATRKSPLALWQSEHVAGLLRQAHPGLEVVLVPMSTRGDEILDRSLAAIGGKRTAQRGIYGLCFRESDSAEMAQNRL